MKESYFETLINNLPDAVIVMDGRGRVEFANKTAEEVLLCGAAELKGRVFLEVFAADALVGLLAAKAINENRPFFARDEALNLGRRFKADVYACPLDGTPLNPPVNMGNCGLPPVYGGMGGRRALVTIREKSIIGVEEDACFDSLMLLVATIAHEIKNPLTAIKASAQMLRAMVEGERAEFVQRIEQGAEKLDGVLNNYLGSSRKPAMNNVNLHEVLDVAVKLTEVQMHRLGVSLERHYDPSLPFIRGDENQLLQVFLNIINNALESLINPGGAATASIGGAATASIGGAATASIGGAATAGELGAAAAGGRGLTPAERGVSIKGRLAIRTRPSDEYLRRGGSVMRWAVVDIEDNGSGIAQTDVERIFTPFYTSKKEGTGLGLSVSRKIIIDHGGTIKVSSTGRTGTTFSIYIPIAPEAAPKSRGAQPRRR
jgi:two-component system nitrogen regulation sensor histidine kinase GlnL